MTFAKPTVGTLDTLALGTAKYTAPARIPHVFVKVSTKVKVIRVVTNQDRTTTTTRDEITASFNVIRRNFLLSAHYHLNLGCESGDVSITLQGTTQTFSNLRFNDDLTVNAGASFFIGPQEIPVIKDCGPCEANLASTQGPLQLNGLIADFRGTFGFYIDGETFQSAALPAYTRKPPPPPPEIFCVGSDSVDLLILAIPAPPEPDPGIYWVLSDKTLHSNSNPVIAGIILFWDWVSVDGEPPSTP